MWRYCCLFMLCACPVEPSDVQTEKEGQPTQKPGEQPGQMGQGNNQGGPNVTPPNGGDLNGNVPPDTKGGQAGMNQGGQAGMDQGGQAGMNQGGQAGMNQGGQAGMDQGGQQGQGDNQAMGVPPDQGNTQDILPMYNEPPNFKDLIKDDKIIQIKLNIEGGKSYNLEFVVSQEINGRKAPKAIHIEKSDSAKMIVNAPMNYEDPVWLVITSDTTGDGPTPDDLFGGSKTPITLGEKDIELSFKLSTDDKWMEELPWYTRTDAVNPPDGSQ